MSRDIMVFFEKKVDKYGARQRSRILVQVYVIVISMFVYSEIKNKEKYKRFVCRVNKCNLVIYFESCSRNQQLCGRLRWKISFEYIVYY